MFLSILVILWTFNGGVWMFIAWIPFVCLSLSLLYMWLGTIIVYDGDGFTVGWLPWQKKYIRYSEITGIKHRMYGAVLFSGKKRIDLDSMVMKVDRFVRYASVKYENIYGTEIPENNTVPKWDIFKGHVERAEDYILAGVVMSLLGIGVLTYFLFDICDDVTEEDTLYMVVNVSSYSVEKDTLVLETEGHQGDFELRSYESYGNVVSPVIEMLDNHQTIYLRVLSYEEDNGEISYDIYQIEDTSGRVLLSFDDTNKRRMVRELKWLFIIFLVWAALEMFFVGAVIVGRNPQKFSKRVQGIFFKDGYLH